MRPAATVVLVNWNGREIIGPCLDALSEQRLAGGVEILVVDNASTDGSDQLVERRAGVRLVRSRRNLGFAGGVNLGIGQARGEYLALLNTDAQARPGWLEHLVQAAQGERVAAVTGKLLFADRPGVIQNAGVLLLSDGSAGDRGSGEPDDGRYAAPEEVFGACGGGMLMSRAALADVGGFDESFFMYYEDTDWSWRARLRGWRILYEPGAVALHAHAASSVEWSDLFTFHADRNRLFTVLKNGDPGFVASSFRSLLGRAAANARTAGDDRPNRGRRRSRVHARVALSLAANLPQLLVKRTRIRSRRKVSDSEIHRWLTPREAWDAR